MTHRNPNLVPKGVVNRRGHSTTVYTRPVTAAADRPDLRAAAVPDPAAPATDPTSGSRRPGTPLPTVTERSDEEITAFLDSGSAPLLYLGPRRGRMLQSPERGAVLIAMDLVSSGMLPLETALRVLDIASVADPATSAAHASDMFRVADSLGYLDSRGDRLDRRLRDAVAGNLLRMQRQISTEEELASSSAVIEFVIAASSWGGRNRVRREYEPLLPGAGAAVASVIVPNRHLDQLLRERPADVHRIMEYVQERRMHPSDPRPVEDLREWLDSGTPTALNPGWL